MGLVFAHRACTTRYLLRLEQQAARSIREGFTVEGDAATATDANGSPAKSLDGTNVKWPSPESESAPSKTANGANNDDDDSSSNPVFTNNPLVRDEPFLKDPAGRHCMLRSFSMTSTHIARVARDATPRLEHPS